MQWDREIIELHDLFQSYFLGELNSIERFERVLEPEFTLIGPDGNISDRNQVLAAVETGHGRSGPLEIVTSDHTVLADRPGVLVARYVETHHLASRTDRRITTVVFTDRMDLPNGVGWLHAHETWIDRGLSD